MTDPLKDNIPDYFASKVVEILKKRRCSDHGCWFGHPGGMGTNGGCRHEKMPRIELRKEFRELVEELMELVR